MSGHSLKGLFAKFGKIVDVTVISDSSTGRSKGFGFITFARELSATKAKKEMNNADVEGRKIVVSIARQNEEKSGYRDNYRRGK
jgi:RNA recognition motif-containing protein